MIKSQTPRVSVVMSVYNGQRFLAKTIESILNQSLSDFEFIIVNDGSIDNTPEIIKKYALKDKRIIVINNSNNLGLIKSLNKGLKIARGKYIARMDADDIAMRNRLQVQYDFLEKNKDIFLVGTYAINVDENGRKVSLFKPVCAPKVIKKKLLKKNCFYHNTIMFRNTKELFYREKMYYTEDYDLYLNCLLLNKKLANIPLYLVTYRRLPNSTSFSKKWKQSLFARKAKEFYLQRLNHGNDQYDSFNPDEILEMSIDNVRDKDILKSEINAHLAVNDLTTVRKLSNQYFKYNGPADLKVWFFYFCSYMRVKDLDALKKVILKIKGKY